LGIRGEANPNSSLTVLWRKRKMILGFCGYRCTKCNTPQFPPLPVCVNPNCQAAGSFEDYEFSSRAGKVEMFTGDLLSPSVDPPAVYGLVSFEGGGKAFVDFTDCDLGEVKVGMPVKMAFRRRTRDAMRGFTGYFWKAVPRVHG
ncbi:MAG TPA: OB-fold domain-containing protein, partial [Deltaproteobacteria bacterium]|nr:OB-fold domain-containing protein [Deltaproteobacteria bacterium]